MVWIYLQESEELPLLWKAMSHRWLIVRSTPIAKASYCRECKKEICPKHQFGTTYELFQRKNYQESTLSMEAFPAKIFQLQDFKKAWKESEAVFFSKFSESSMKRKLPSYSLKTCQTLGPKEQSEFAKSWSKEGMIVDGVIYPLVMWERGTKEKDGSYWATPTTMDVLPPRSKEAMENHFRIHRPGRTKPPTLKEQIVPELWPTPQFWDGARGPAKKYDPKSKKQVERTLVTFTKHYPTPNLPDVATSNKITGQLNPDFVELLMIYPLHWTRLKEPQQKQKTE